MDFQFWIWLIIVVVTLLSRAMKKSANRPGSPSGEPRQEAEPDHKPISFEELLKEIQTSKTPQQAPKPAELPKPVKSYQTDYDENIEEEEDDLETIPEKEDRSYEVYEKAKREAFTRPSLEETLKLEDTVMKYSHFKEYDESSQRSIAKEVLADFKDPEGFKKAFIMSEILKRKF